MRVFVDTSVFVAALFSQTGASFYILSNTHELGIALVTSDYVLTELHQTVTRKFPDFGERLMAFLADTDLAIVHTPSPTTLRAAKRIIGDPKDAPILAAFMRTRISILISLDTDFLKLQLTGRSILTPGDFLMRLRTGDL